MPSGTYFSSFTLIVASGPPAAATDDVHAASATRRMEQKFILEILSTANQ
jgi:hypothetical protein